MQGLFLSHILIAETYLEDGLRRSSEVTSSRLFALDGSCPLYEKAGKLHEQSEALTYLAQAYQAIGQYKQALKASNGAALAKKSGDRTQIASVLGSLGSAYVATGPVDAAYGI